MRSVKRASLRPLIQTVFCAIPTRKPICLLLNAVQCYQIIENVRTRRRSPTNHHNLYLWVDFVFIKPESRTVVLQIGPHYVRIYGWCFAVQNKYLFGSKFWNQIDAERLQSFKIQMHVSWRQWIRSQMCVDPWFPEEMILRVFFRVILGGSCRQGVLRLPPTSIITNSLIYCPSRTPFLAQLIVAAVFVTFPMNF